MKVPRSAFYTVAGIAAAAAIFAAVALDPRFQTWALRRELAARPDLHASVGAVAVGMEGLRIDNLSLARGGMTLVVPSIEAEFRPIPAVLFRRVSIGRLVAKGWTLDLTRARPDWASAAPGRRAPDFSLVSSAVAGEPAGSLQRAPAAAFQGVFNWLHLPFDLTLDGVELEGDVILPGSRSGARPIRVHVVVDGGGIAAGRAGNFTFDASLGTPGPGSPVNALRINGTLGASMGDPRTFTRIFAKIQAAAAGPKFPRGVRLAADAGATREAAGESYALTLTGDSKELVSARAKLPDDTRRLSGDWSLNVCDADLGPFMLGRACPAFNAVGAGRFEADTMFSEMRASGTLDASADRLEAVAPALAAVGAVRIKADFDVTHRESRLRVDRLQATVSGARPIFSVAGLQPFAFDAGTGELQVADATRDLFGVVLQEVPLEWARPFLSGLDVTGNPLRGEFVASAQKGGLTVRSKTPLAITDLSVRRGDRILAHGVDVVLGASADYTPQGWQVEITSFKATGAGTPANPFLVLSARVGRLAGAGQAVKLAGRLTADLSGVLAQPAFQGSPSLVRGDMACDFAASLTAQSSVQVKVAVSHLAAAPGLAGPLPDLAADVRADFDGKGNMAFSAPVTLQGPDRKSDLTLAGTLTGSKSGVAIDGQLSSTRLYADDLKVLAAPFFGRAPTPAPGARTAPAPWAGCEGKIRLALGEVAVAGLSVKNLKGTLEIGPAAIGIEGLSAKVDDGSITADCRLGFSSSAKPYSLQGRVQVEDFNPARLFRAVEPDQPPTVDGEFDLTARFAGYAATPGDLVEKATGECQVVSKGGTFRMLSATVAPKVEAAGTIAAIGAFLGNVAGAVTSRKDAGDMASAAQAISSFAKLISPIHFDQLSLVLTRDATLDTILRDFALIAPEVRLTGQGKVAYVAGTRFLDQPLSMEFKAGARGHAADLLKFLGALEPAADNLGYAACTLPLKVGGTLARPDKSEIEEALTRLAVERSGAAEFLNKLLGK